MTADGEDEYGIGDPNLFHLVGFGRRSRIRPPFAMFAVDVAREAMAAAMTAALLSTIYVKIDLIHLFSSFNSTIICM